MTTLPDRANDNRFRKASQVVADALRYEIGMRILADNAALPPEHELIERFGVSRPTLREAIRILETEGLLTTARGGTRGHRIHHPGPRQAARQASLALRLRGASMTDVFVLASILVPPAVRMVAEQRPLPDLSELLRLYEQMARQRERPRLLARTIRQFDIAVCDLCGNEAIAFVARMIAEIIELQIDEIPEEVGALPPENAAQLVPAWERFGKVLDALAAGDGALAEKLMHQRMVEMIGYHRRVMDTASPLRMLS